MAGGTSPARTARPARWRVRSSRPHPSPSRPPAKTVFTGSFSPPVAVRVPSGHRDTPNIFKDGGAGEGRHHPSGVIPRSTRDLRHAHGWAMAPDPDHPRQGDDEGPGRPACLGAYELENT